ncbi:C-C motif chemokine 4 homolog [Ictalurus furcatus]|uniref:C-C motif chemokine 4 homolog n=1 Tax=Ictalurus furcatus TaxID=66913 RepID=UPI002350A04B|nr:C-C motif chemokine 4 homolog [Ictalurus furcatus]
MSSGSLLLVLLVLGCLQSFTAAQRANPPESCCFNFQRNIIPLRMIKGYKETRLDCTKAGIMFILNNGIRVCTDPGDLWVKNHMKKIDLRFFADPIQHQKKC